MISWLRRLLMGDSKIDHTAIEAREQEVVERLARATGRTPDQVRRDARRRALRIEADSYRGRQH